MTTVKEFKAAAHWSNPARDWKKNCVLCCHCHVRLGKAAKDQLNRYVHYCMEGAFRTSRFAGCKHFKP